MSETKIRRPNWRKRPTFVRDEILRLADGTRTSSDIADALVTTTNYVADVCRHYGGKLKFSKNCADSRWTDAMVARLTHLLRLGWSYGKIGADIGVSRNAAIGKAKRLGIQHISRVARPTVARLAKPKRERILPAKKIAQLRSLPAEPLPPPKIEDVATVTFDKLTEAHCKWPVDFPSGKTGYCGGKRVPLLPYCDGHCRRAYINYGHVPVTKAPAAAPVTEVV